MPFYPIDDSTKQGLQFIITVVELDPGFVPTFQMALPNSGSIDLAEFRALVDGLTLAKLKVESVIEALENNE